MTESVVHISFSPGQPEIVTALEALLKRAYHGAVLGIAIIEHRHGDAVAIEVVNPACSYHHLNSGAARLAHLLASAATEGDTL